MAACSSVVLVLAVMFLSTYPSEQLQSSQAQTLLRIQGILNFPVVLSSWNNDTDFCNTEPNSSLTVVCYEESISQLHIIGNKGAPKLLNNFSMDSFVTTLVKLPDLKVLTLVSLGLWGSLPAKLARLSSLEIVNMSSNFLYGSVPREFSSLKNLQTLILDRNMFVGRLPDWLSSLPLMSVLSLSKNSFNGTLPKSLSRLESLRVLSLSHNHFYGEVPDLSSLTNLQVLDLEDNSLGPRFPRLSNKLVTLILRKNKFRSAIPTDLSSCYQLQRLDISFNSFVGPFLPSLISLPSISYFNIAGNKLTGKLSENLSCNTGLKFVDLSWNLLSGSLPDCLVSDPKDKIALYARNCFATRDQNQHPFSFCRNEALAVGIIAKGDEQKQASKAVIALGIVGGIVGAIALVGLIFLLVRRMNARRRRRTNKHPTRVILEHASNGYTPKLLSDARYISQSIKLGALGLATYRCFSLEELVEATQNFNTSAFMGEGSLGQMYRGRLRDGSLVAIRCLKLKRSHDITQNFMHHVELISKLRHLHLVNALGHCFEYYLDDSNVTRIFLVFEYVPNGTLRSWISGNPPVHLILTEFANNGKLNFVERRGRQPLTWAQRIGAALGVAKGIQFLHSGIVPAMFSNNLKITNVLLDQNLVAKVGSYNLPLLAECVGKDGNKTSSKESREASTNAREKQGDKRDIYDFGVMLLEMMVGRALETTKEVEIEKDQLQRKVMGGEGERRSMVDPAVSGACSGQSLKTVMEVCGRCVGEDRPSIEDVIWNLQFAVQVQDAWGWGGDTYCSSSASQGSPS